MKEGGRINLGKGGRDIKKKRLEEEGRKEGGTIGSFGWSRRSCCHFRIVAAEASAFRRFAAGDGWVDDVHEAAELSHPSIISM
jgi:hypothetical protein